MTDLLLQPVVLQVYRPFGPNHESDIDRTNSKGKTSSVHFLHFDFNQDQIEQFHSNEAKIYLGIEHKNYSHITILNDENINNLKEDLL